MLARFHALNIFQMDQWIICMTLWFILFWYSIIDKNSSLFCTQFNSSGPHGLHEKGSNSLCWLLMSQEEALVGSLDALKLHNVRQINNYLNVVLYLKLLLSESQFRFWDLVAGLFDCKTDTVSCPTMFNESKSETRLRPRVLVLSSPTNPHI